MAKKQKARAKKLAAPSRRRIAPPRDRAQPAPAALDLHRCVLFLEHEARLLDEAKFDDWLALFTLDGWYWVPSEPNQNNPHETVSLIYDDRRLLETRVRRLASPRMYSQEPRSRTSRIVANATIEDAEGRAATVRSKFLMIEYRREQQRLFTADAWYWVPSEPGQSNPHDTVSLIYDDRRLLETRVRRLASPRMYSQEPRSRTSRIVANATIEDAEGCAATVRSKFLMIEYRREQQRLFAGTAWHRLVQLDGAIRIAWKRVDLVNCDAPLDGITQPF